MPPSKERYPILDHPTPRLADWVFYEIRESRLAGNNPEKDGYNADYGDKHPEPTRYPNHELVFIAPHDQEGTYRWYYAAERANQDEYNYDIQYPYNGDTNYPRYVRFYLVKGDAYTPASLGDVDPVDSNAILVSEQMREDTGDERLNSLYVLVTRVYDHVPDISDANDLNNLKQFGYAVSHPFGLAAYPRVTWRFPIQLSIYNANTAADLSACPIPNYTTLKLTDKGMSPEADAHGVGIVTRIFDVVPGPTIGSDEKLGEGREIPPKFRVSADVEADTTHNMQLPITLDTPAGDPLVGGALVSSTERAAGGVVGQKLNVTYTGTKGDLERVKLDPLTGTTITETIRLVTKAAAAGSNVDASGNYTAVEPINQYWSAETDTKTTNLTTRSWWTQENYYWPPVLTTIPTFSPINRRNAKNTGTYTTGYETWYDIKEAYNGPVKVQVTQTWSQTAPGAVIPVAMQPEAMTWNGYLTRGSIPRCLHGLLSITEQTGTNHPVFPLATNTWTWPATNYTDWPATITVTTVTNWNMGYLKTEKVYYAPGT